MARTHVAGRGVVQVKRVELARNKAAYEMHAAVARQLLKALRG